MEAARVLSWEGLELDEVREITRKMKADEKLYLVRKLESEKKDHTYTVSEGFTL